jgi:hypothetical protein
LINFGVAIVLRSEDPKVKVGDHVYGLLGESCSILVIMSISDGVHKAFQAYINMPSASALRVLENKEKLPWSVYVGAAGMPGEVTSRLLMHLGLMSHFYTGQTAFLGWREFSKAKKVFGQS